MELLTQLSIEDPDIEVLVSRDLKERHPQINCKTNVVYIRSDKLEIDDFDTARFVNEALLPHHEHLREDIKEEIRGNLGQIINDKNYLMKIADKYYQDKIKYYSTKTYPLELLYCEFYGKRMILEYVYLPENDTIYVRQQ